MSWPCRSSLGSPYHILNGSENSPVMCAQEHANYSSGQEHNVSSSVAVHEPAADQDGLFVGFFHESATRALDFSSLLMNIENSSHLLICYSYNYDVFCGVATTLVLITNMLFE